MTQLYHKSIFKRNEKQFSSRTEALSILECFFLPPSFNPLAKHVAVASARRAPFPPAQHPAMLDSRGRI